MSKKIRIFGNFWTYDFSESTMQSSVSMFCYFFLNISFSLSLSLSFFRNLWWAEFTFCKISCGTCSKRWNRMLWSSTTLSLLGTYIAIRKLDHLCRLLSWCPTPLKADRAATIMLVLFLYSNVYIADFEDLLEKRVMEKLIC